MLLKIVLKNLLLLLLVAFDLIYLTSFRDPFPCREEDRSSVVVVVLPLLHGARMKLYS